MLCLELVTFCTQLSFADYKLPLPQNSCYNTTNVNLEVTTASEMADILDNEHLISSLGVSICLCSNIDAEPRV